MATFSSFAEAQMKLNVADPSTHPYANPQGGREGLTLADHEVNEFRIYDFYQRQADYYMQSTTPRFIPAFPGLDAGLHGHWGKHNQNNHEDGRWNEQIHGGMIGGRLNVDKVPLHKAVNLQLGEKQQLSASFDPWTLTYREVWSGGFVEYNPYRWGTSRGLTRVGDAMFKHSGVWRGNDPNTRITDAKYHGVYRHGAAVAFAYSIGKLEMIDAPWAEQRGDHPFWTRRIQLTAGAKTPGRIPLISLPKNTKLSKTSAPNANSTLGVYEVGDERWIVSVSCTRNKPSLRVTETAGLQNVDLDLLAPSDDRIAISIWKGNIAEVESALKVATDLPSDEPKLAAFMSGGKARWTETVTLRGKRSEAEDPYVVDTIPLPFENPFNTVMMLSGIDFLPNGDAMVCTLGGDVWKVSGINDDLKSVVWKRFAAGLAQPFGIKYDDGKLFVLAKDRLHILHDLNDDGEADFYENYDNSWVETRGHTHVFGLDRDAEGNFYFPAYDLYYKLPPDGSGVQLMAKGFRNCMGAAVSDKGLVLAAPQEGTWTPASMIIEVRKGEHYGFQRKDEPINSPMCFVPRGVDNSTGGMVFVDSERWGPLGKSIIGLSYGYGSHYLILRDEKVKRTQGATVPLPGEFLSGVVRGRINPKDGQLYLVGTDGWGNYAIQDGCLQRVRYTHKPVYKPIGFRVHSNGLRIDFTDPVDAEAASDLKNYFVDQWNYEHSKRYGSPEMSVFRPHMLGHDPVVVESVHLLEGGRSVFLEIPRIVPCYQMHIRMHLKGKDGTEFKTDIFPTVLSLGDRFEFEGAKPATPGKRQELVLRVREEKAVPLKFSNPKLKTARTLTIRAVNGIRYDRPTLVAHAGEAIELKLKNEDGMPHNIVIVQPGAYEKVGTLSFKMLNDPAAFDRHYVPDTPEIVAHTKVVFPKETASMKFVTPTTPGAYPFLCTFPGHWQTMRGQLILIPKGEPLPDAADLQQERATLAYQLEQEDIKELLAAARESGNPKRGAALFYNKRVSCATCHDPETKTVLGPKLTERHDKTTDLHLLESILHPSKTIRTGYESVVVMTFDGKMRAGVRVSEDEKTIELRDLTAGELLKYRKEDLDEIMPSKVSMMPAGLANNLANRQQFLDLARFVLEISEGGEERLKELKP